MMTNDELISVLIPCRNAALFLGDCLESVLRQKTDVPVEIIVVDDGSEDHTAEICSRYPSVKYFRQESAGVSAARNCLISEASGTYIAFADADDLYAENKLALQLQYLREHPECPFAGCAVMSFQGELPSEPYAANERTEKFLIPALIRKSVIEKTGLFDETLAYGEDTEYKIRMKRLGITGEHYLPEVLYLRRKHPNHRLSDRTGDMMHDIAATIIKGRKNAASRKKESAAVSLIVPCYNAQDYIAEFLQSVLAQTYRPLEVILVDDGSEDATADIIREWLPKLENAGIRTCFLPCEHRNQSHAVNEGLKHFTGAYLTWADCDDLLHPDNIAAKVRFLEAHPECGLVRNHSVKLENGTCTVLPPSQDWKETEDIFEPLFQETISPIAGCFMVRTSLFRTCYPEGQIVPSTLGQNLQLALPAAGRSLCGYIPDALMTYRIHSDSHSQRKRTMREALARIEELRRILKDAVNRSGRDPSVYCAMADARCDDLRQSVFRAIKTHHQTHDDSRRNQEEL